MGLLNIRPGKKLSSVAAESATKFLASLLKSKKAVGSNVGYDSRQRLPKSMIIYLQKEKPEIAKHINDKGRFRPKTEEKIVFEAYKTLRDAGAFKHQKGPAYLREQDTLRFLRKADRLSKEEAKELIARGPKGFEKWKNSQSQSSNLNPTEQQFQEAKDQLELAKRLEAQTKIERFQNELDRLNLEKLKNDPLRSGEYIREAVNRRVHGDETTPASEPRREVNNDDDQEGRNETGRSQESRPPIDPLGPYDLAA